MAGKAYVTKGYTAYTGIPTRPGGYDHGPKTPVNQYENETKTIERVHARAGWSTEFVGSPSKLELLKEYVHSPTMSSSPYPNYGPNYENSSPHKFHNEGSWPMKNSNFSSPNKHNPSAPVHSSSSQHAQSWQSVGPPMTHHHLTTSTNNIHEALGFLESVKHSSRSNPRQRGVLDELSTRAQPLEPQKRYARPAFVAKSNSVYKKRY